MQFVKNDKVVRSVSLQNPTINLGKANRAASVSLSKDSTGKSRSFTSAPRPRGTVSGELQAEQKKPAGIRIRLAGKGAKVESLKVNAATRCSCRARSASWKVTNAKRQGDCGKIRFHRLGDVHRFRKRAQRYFPRQNHRQHSRLALCRS